MTVSTDPFAGGLYLAFYRYMEEDFIEYMKKVPFTKDHEKVHSPSLLAQILLACSYIDTAFKDMARYNGFSNEPACQAILKSRRQYNIKLAKEAYEPIYHLSQKKVIAKLDWCGDRELIPFETFSGEEKVSPKWWKAYQESKHNWTKAFKKANMNNALEALSGAFLLNAVHFPSIKLLHDFGIYEFGVKRPTEFSAVPLPPHSRDQLIEAACKTHQNIKYDAQVETDLFIYTNLRQ
jgi:hypothetical protein